MSSSFLVACGGSAVIAWKDLIDDFAALDITHRPEPVFRFSLMPRSMQFFIYKEAPPAII
jgi:hypothetical protein